MATLHLVLAAILLASTHAQSDFCEKGSTRQVRSGRFVSEEMETKFFAIGERATPTTNNNHDVVEGNCTDLATNVFKYNECATPNPDGVAYRRHTYRFDEGSIIYCVKSLDRHEDGRGGYPVIADGGVGSAFVSLEYYSQPRQGLKFYTEVYAR